ncbi:integrin beta-1-like [Pungitius pungitius]|uniref:integrin beta-1-like n=1 Tax=Pungitius pungitius TaxID=134920 RepID=UPI001887308E|nr:integrin beta-1-like [Pungitius pungitius]
MSALKLLVHLGLLLVLSCLCCAEELKCSTSAHKCDECIQSGPACAWCSAPNSNLRCDTLKGLRRAGCLKSYVFNPRGRVQVVKNDSGTEPADAHTLSLQPREVSLYLRPGLSESFPLTITVPTEQPITELIMDTSTLPAGVNITFKNTVNENPLVVQVTVTATQCPSERDDLNQNRTGPWPVHIIPRGFLQSVKLEINLECQCDCSRNHEENSPGCGGRGALVCGQCECLAPYTGQQCQRDISSIPSQNDDFCRSGPNAPVCSGRGKCREGFCECETRANKEERYSGMFCECSNFDCTFDNNRMCGGHGKCECGRCVCDEGWTGEVCACTIETASCSSKNQKLCNDNGMCICGICKCESHYFGRTCEDSFL